MLRFQRTIKHSISFEGVGLHTGASVRMTLLPAPADTGVVFLRTDSGYAEIRAVAANRAATGYATTLGSNGTTVQTVEHLLGALAGLGIDNAIIEIDGEEVPIMDGSARPFVKGIVDAGIVALDKVQPVLKIVKPLFVREDGKQLAIWPAETPSVSSFIDFDHPLLREQSVNVPVSEESFLREVSDARTFGFLRDEPTLRERGLAKGASLDNTIVLSDDGVLNRDGLRSHDEFVRHKVLDVIGDLALVGMPIIGHVVAHKPGHSLNAKMVTKLLNSPWSWIVLGAADDTASPARRQEVRFAEHAAI